MDDKTQKLIDKATKTAKKDTMTAVNGAIKSLNDAIGDTWESPDAKKAVKATLKQLKTDIKDATAE